MLIRLQSPYVFFFSFLTLFVFFLSTYATLVFANTYPPSSDDNCYNNGGIANGANYGNGYWIRAAPFFGQLDGYCYSNEACVTQNGHATCQVKYIGTTCASLNGSCQYDAYTCSNIGGSELPVGNLDCAFGGSRSVCCIPHPAPSSPTSCHGNGYCIHSSPQTCGSGTQTVSDGSCGSGTFDRCCVPPSSHSVPTASCGQGNNNGDDNGTCGADMQDVYYCYQGTWTIKTHCSNGCQINSGIADTCSGSGDTTAGSSGGTTGGTNTSVSAPVNTPSGNGIPNASCGPGDNNGGNNGWCGTDNNVYYCYQYNWHLKTSCSNGCQINSGIADTCKPGSPPVAQAASAPTPIRTAPPGPTPTVGPTIATIGVRFEGIDSLNNTTPKHFQRVLTIYLYSSNAYTSDPTSAHPTYKATDILILQQRAATSSNASFGIFASTDFALGKIPTGDYYILVKSPEGSLRQLLSNQKIHITAGTNTILEDISNTNSQSIIPQLQMGDLNNDNLVNIIDYNYLRDCFGSNITQITCTNHNIKDTYRGFFVDINDDGIVDGIDYNIILRNMNSHGN